MFVCIFSFFKAEHNEAQLKLKLTQERTLGNYQKPYHVIIY